MQPRTVNDHGERTWSVAAGGRSDGEILEVLVLAETFAHVMAYFDEHDC